LNGNWTAKTLTAVMKNYIQTLITHWGRRCYSWDVVNEALASDGSFSSSIVSSFFTGVLTHGCFNLYFQMFPKAGEAVH
jgi:GH35 family endo-1,4-beta-xylanase